jgi:hypothetical protein
MLFLCRKVKLHVIHGNFDKECLAKLVFLDTFAQNNAEFGIS